MPSNLSDQLADGFLSHQVDLLRFEAGERHRILGLLRRLETELVEKIGKVDPTGPSALRYRFQRQQRLLKEVRTVIGTAYRDMAKVSGKGLRGLAELESEWVKDAVNGALGIELMTTTLAKEQLRAVASDTLIQGARSAEWWSRQSRKLQERFSDEIRTGILAGESIDDMVRRIRGKATGRKHKYWLPGEDKGRWYHEFKGGIMDTGTRQAAGLVRTSVQEVAGAARAEMYQANADILNGVQQLSTLDPRTTELCMAYDGATWDMEGNPIDPKPMPWLGWGAAHWNCRRVIIPIVKSWDELGLSGIEEMPPGTRASMNGQVAGTKTMDDWLKGMDRATQERMLGKGKAKLWREGKIKLTDLVDQTGRTMTLKDLRAGKLKTASTLKGMKPVITPSKVISKAKVVEKVKELPKQKLSLGEYDYETHDMSWGDLSRLHNEWLYGLPAQERDELLNTILEYVNGSNGYDANFLLRAMDSKAAEDPFIQSMKSFFSRAPAMPRQSTVYRGIHYKELFGDIDPEDLVGTEFTDLGFVSTSLDSDVATEFTDMAGYVMEIRVPPGSKPMYLDPMSSFIPENAYQGSLGHENEVLFDGGRFVISDVFDKTILVDYVGGP